MSHNHNISFDNIVIKSEKLSDDEHQNTCHNDIPLAKIPKKRGRKPKPREPVDPNYVPPPVIRLDKYGNVIQKKPRKPRKKEEKGSRKPYKKRAPKTPNNTNLQSTLYGNNMANIPIKSEFIREITSETAQYSTDIPLMDTFKDPSLSHAESSNAESSHSSNNTTRKNEDINTLLFGSLFNKRIVADMTVADESVTFIFQKLEDCLKTYAEDSIEYKIFKSIEEKFHVVYNKLASIEKVLGPFCINLMRGYNASKMSPIPIQRPWDTRTEILNNESKTFLDLQKAINEYCFHISCDQLNEENPTDEELLLSQKASSFFTGKSIENDSIPPYLYNSDWLIEATGSSRKEKEKILVGGGDLQSAAHHTHSIHTVIPSYRNDLNHGIDLPDIPLNALKVMELDKQEKNINSQKNLPVSDPPSFV